MCGRQERHPRPSRAVSWPTTWPDRGALLVRPSAAADLPFAPAEVAILKREEAVFGALWREEEEPHPLPWEEPMVAPRGVAPHAKGLVEEVKADVEAHDDAAALAASDHESFPVRAIGDHLQPIESEPDGQSDDDLTPSDPEGNATADDAWERSEPEWSAEVEQADEAACDIADAGGDMDPDEGWTDDGAEVVDREP